MATLTSTEDPLPHTAWWQGALVYEIDPRSFADPGGDPPNEGLVLAA